MSSLSLESQLVHDVADECGLIDRCDEQNNIVFLDNREGTRFDIHLRTGLVNVFIDKPRMSIKSIEEGIDVFNPMHCITQPSKVQFQLTKFFKDPRFRSGAHDMSTLGTLRYAFRTCSRCGHDVPRKAFTSHEWRKSQGDSICKECVLPSLYPYTAEKMSLG